MAESQADQELILEGSKDFEALSRVLNNVQSACEALPKEEQESFRAAQQSIVDARRSAETHEGLLQVC